MGTVSPAPADVVQFKDIENALERLKNITLQTNCPHSRLASKRMGADVFFKMENEQRTGSFKLRGAYNMISSLSVQERANGVIACSAGNHAQGVAYSSQLLGVDCTVVMPTNASLVKITHTESYGAKVLLHGAYFDEAAEQARAMQQSKGHTFIPPFEHPLIMAGQGTLGLEIVAQVPDVEQVIIPVGGGGLISGVATAIKALRPSCQIIGVQSALAPGMERLFHHRDPTVAATASTIADGIAVKKPSRYMYENYISRLVDEMVLVTDDEIAAAIVYVMEASRSLVEGSGAAGLAAALADKIKLKKRVCIVLSGGNIDLNIVSRVIDKGLQLKGRLARLSVMVPDFPGSLSRLTQVIAQEQANVMEVHHDRISAGINLKETRIDFVIETRSHEHVDRIRRAIEANGARVL